MGTVLADFVHIMGDGPVPVNPAGVNQEGFSRPFDTGGIRTDQAVILMFSVQPVANPPPARAGRRLYQHSQGRQHPEPGA